MIIVQQALLSYYLSSSYNFHIFDYDNIISFLLILEKRLNSQSVFSLCAKYYMLCIHIKHNNIVLNLEMDYILIGKIECIALYFYLIEIELF